MNTHNDADIFRERQLVIYKRYSIRRNPINNLIWVERDGTRICFAETLADAKAKIDEIADTKE